MSAFLELAERCEKATKPDRELDLAIGAAVGEADHSGPAYHRPFKDWAKPYTTSIDAAMMLIPQGFCFDTQSVMRGSALFDRPKAWAQVEETDGPIIETSASATLPLALCAAALRARAALSHNGTRKER